MTLNEVRENLTARGSRKMSWNANSQPKHNYWKKGMLQTHNIKLPGKYSAIQKTTHV